MLLGLVAAASITICPAIAGARPKPLQPKPTLKLLPHRPCKGLLSVGDFPGAATEGPGPPGFFDLFEIFKEGAAGVPQLLKKVAGELTGGAS